MPESTFAVTFDELAAEVGRFLGYGRGVKYGESAWTDRQKGAIEPLVKAGVHRFYYPEPLPGETAGHTWSFLQPVETLTLASGASTILLPADFAGFEGPLTNMTSGARPTLIPLRDKSFLDQQYAVLPDSTGRPQWAAERPQKQVLAGRGQRSELYVWPLADQDYTIRCCYYLLPNCLDGSHQHCYGGAAHAQTVLQSCLALAEERQLGGTGGAQSLLWTGRLAASVSIDRRNKPESLGYNGDGPDNAGGGWRDLPSTQVTVYGASY